MVCCKVEKFVVLIYLWVWWSTSSTSIHAKAENNDSLKAGDTLNGTSELCSKQGTCCMNFAIYGSGNQSNHAFVQINAREKDDWDVWVANRNQPVDADSAVLVLDHSGVLKIESNTTRKPIILYSSPQPILLHNSRTIVATLLDTGNFVVQQIRSNGMNTVLWQSFDYPTDTLLPGIYTFSMFLAVTIGPPNIFLLYPYILSNYITLFEQRHA